MSVHRPLDSPEGAALPATLRSVCARLPEVTEHVDGFGHATFKVEALIEDGWRMAAPKSLRKTLP